MISSSVSPPVGPTAAAGPRLVRAGDGKEATRLSFRDEDEVAQHGVPGRRHGLDPVQTPTPTQANVDLPVACCYHGSRASGVTDPDLNPVKGVPPPPTVPRIWDP
jgi:hypothetical protein